FNNYQINEVLEVIVSKHNIVSGNNKVEGKIEEDIILFIQVFSDFIFDYLDEKISEYETTLFSLIRFKEYVEWFVATKYIKIINDNKDRYKATETELKKE